MRQHRLRRNENIGATLALNKREALLLRTKGLLFVLWSAAGESGFAPSPDWCCVSNVFSSRFSKSATPPPKWTTSFPFFSCFHHFRSLSSRAYASGVFRLFAFTSSPFGVNLLTFKQIRVKVSPSRDQQRNQRKQLWHKKIQLKASPLVVYGSSFTPFAVHSLIDPFANVRTVIG